MALDVRRGRRHRSRQAQQLRELQPRGTVGWWWRGWGGAGDQGCCSQPGWCWGHADGGRVGTPTKLTLLVALNLFAFSLMCVGSDLFVEFLRREVTVWHAFLCVSAQRAHQVGWAKRWAEPTKSIFCPLSANPWVVPLFSCLDLFTLSGSPEPLTQGVKRDSATPKSTCSPLFLLL